MPCWAFLFIFSPSDIYFPQGEESFYQLVWGQMIKESGTLVSLRTKNKYAGEMGALALNNAQVLFAWVCQCLRGLVEEELTSWPWKQDIRCCVHVQRWDVPTSTYSNHMSSNPGDDVSSWRQQNCFTNRRVIRPSGDSFVFCLFVFTWNASPALKSSELSLTHTKMWPILCWHKLFPCHMSKFGFQSVNTHFRIW